MGLFSCHLSCQRDDESQTGSNHLHSESSSSSISSQPSLPSLPSLTSPSQTHDEQAPTPTVQPKCIATLKNYSLFALALVGKVLYSGSSNGEIRAWRHDNQTDNTVVATTNSAVKSLAVLGDKIFSAHQDSKIRVGKIHKHLEQKYKCIEVLPTLTDRFLKCFSEKNYVQVRRHKKRTWVHHVDAVSALAISKDCSLLYSASWDRTFKNWRTSDFKCLESVQNAHDDAINAIVISQDGFVYTGSADKTIKARKKHTEKKNKHLLVATLEKHKSAVNALALSNDGTQLYSGACDRSILVWERESSVRGGLDRHMVLVGALRGHSKAILCLAVDAMDLICSGSADKTVRIWRRSETNRKSYSCLAVLEGHKKPVKCLTVAVVNGDANIEGASESGTTYIVYSGSLDYDIKVWQVSAPVL
ncbi:protein JINGUBANG [Canna indica]|uniref:Protein JINGUBANG n=1 Tax=Canna indica TaxID=4628 RepID=A0AAQ3K4A5_9LILI|nr:protein JINGUBANG [Canna indica]